MPERSSKRKARRDSLTSSIGELESSSLRTVNIPSISDRDFAEISEKIEKSIGRRVKDTEAGQREILKRIENLSSKIDSLSGQASNVIDPDANENCPESLIPTSRPIEVNKLTRGECQHTRYSISFLEHKSETFSNSWNKTSNNFSELNRYFTMNWNPVDLSMFLLCQND